jgi:NTE family protein
LSTGKSTERKPIHLALQGGGAHGAFTWGVLDFLLEDNRLKIEAISGTSAGALNAAAMASSYALGDIDGARECLYNLWQAMNKHGVYSPYNFSGVSPMAAKWGEMLSWVFPIFAFTSPYQNNPLNIHFLKELLEEHINFDALNNNCANVRLFVSATNVRSNKLYVFTNQDLSVEVLLASSCLPRIHRAVEIAGDFFWDGGYMGNPALEPLVRDRGAEDILIIQVNPIHINHVPTSPMEISERMETIAFNSSLSREIRHIAEIDRLIDTGELKAETSYGKYLHLLQAENEMAKYSTFTKYDTSWPFLTKLHDLGRKTAATWLDENYDSIGQRNTLQLESWQPTYHQPVCNLFFND